MRSVDPSPIRARVSAALVAVCLTSLAAPSPVSAQDAAPTAAPAPPAADGASDAQTGTSTEKTVGIVLLATAGAAVATGIGFGIASVIEHRRSRDLLQGATEEEADLLATQSAYAEAVAARDDLRVGSGIAAGAGLLMFLAAGTLFAIDEANDAPVPAPRAVAAPILGPDRVGAGATFRF